MDSVTAVVENLRTAACRRDLSAPPVTLPGMTGHSEQPSNIAPLVRLPLLAGVAGRPDATLFVHDRRLPPVPPARPRS